MNPIPSTAEILAYRSLDRLTDKVWTDWAYDMLIAGFESEHLLILAGMEQPLEYFEMRILTEKVLSELKLDYSDTDAVIRNYISYLANLALTGQTTPSSVLGKLNQIYIEMDYYRPLAEFSDLYYANEDLLTSEVQWYIDDADRSNIDRIIYEHLQRWVLPNF